MVEENETLITMTEKLESQRAGCDAGPKLGGIRAIILFSRINPFLGRAEEIRKLK